MVLEQLILDACDATTTTVLLAATHRPPPLGYWRVQSASGRAGRQGSRDPEAHSYQPWSR